ncbi:MAG TPA: flagellar biosynthetic protein FliO [Candidatus Sulfotelmatobacter sp.]|nr:flagellar biosynthetic protein FliO [Candidatus Sulfotelmatobacter sp.]
MSFAGIKIAAPWKADALHAAAVVPRTSELPQQFRKLWQRIFMIGPKRTRRLRLCETLPLGDRRFVAVIEFEEMRYLIGGTSSSLSLLAQLETKAQAIAPEPAE